MAYADYQIGENGYTYKDALNKTFKKENIKNVSTKKEKYIIEFNNTDKKYYYDISSGNAGEYLYVDPFNYGTKKKSELAPGDDITLETEKFKVFSVENGEIKAIPYYNLKLDSNPIKQATEATASTAGESTFSTTYYWNKGDNEIKMDDSRNNVQKYITAYKTTLEGLGAEEIEVRISRYTDFGSPNLHQQTNGNPSLIGRFWVGSSFGGLYDYVFTIGPTGSIDDERYNFNYYKDPATGVRPIIIIK